MYLEAVLLGAYKFVILIFREWFLLLCSALFFLLMLFSLLYFIVIFCLFFGYLFFSQTLCEHSVLAIFSDYYFMAYINAFFLPVLFRYN